MKVISDAYFVLYRCNVAHESDIKWPHKLTKLGYAHKGGNGCTLFLQLDKNCK